MCKLCLILNHGISKICHNERNRDQNIFGWFCSASKNAVNNVMPHLLNPYSLHKKWSSPLRISSVNVTKSKGNCEFVKFTDAKKFSIKNFIFCALTMALVFFLYPLKILSKPEVFWWFRGVFKVSSEWVNIF